MNVNGVVEEVADRGNVDSAAFQPRASGYAAREIEWQQTSQHK